MTTTMRQCDLCPTCDETVGFVDDTRLLKVCNHCDIDGDNFNLKEWHIDCQIEVHRMTLENTEDVDEWHKQHDVLMGIIDRRKEELRQEIHHMKQRMDICGYGSQEVRLLHSLENRLHELE